MPLISVVVPTHGRRELLIQTIRSVLRQRDADLELIVVDDGSRDGTDEAVRSFSDSRLRLLRNDEPMKVATARNMGVAASRGEWIAFLDDDDLWAPDKVSMQLTAAHAAGRKWVYGGVIEIDANGRYLGGERPPRPETLMGNLAKRNLMPAGCSNVLVRSELLERVGGFEATLRHLADWDLWLRLARHGPPSSVSRPLVAYRIHDGQASMDITGMIEEARLLEARHGADRASILRWLAWSCLRQGRRWDAVRAYGKAVLAGDLVSLGRVVVAAVHPDPTRFGRHPPSAAAIEWRRQAGEWLEAALD